MSKRYFDPELMARMGYAGSHLRHEQQKRRTEARRRNAKVYR